MLLQKFKSLNERLPPQTHVKHCVLQDGIFMIFFGEGNTRVYETDAWQNNATGTMVVLHGVKPGIAIIEGLGE